ncbi:ATP-grasp domain-containing protein [Symmachiella dynata]|uniref:ATP-grasp domain-containing protein n=1 Tax=Symmachiella dynata TaxID=2527995 RepID=UPI0030EC869E
MRDKRLDWLIELNSLEIQQSHPDDMGFLFGYESGVEVLARQVADRPHIHDRPEERRDLIGLDDVLGKLDDHGIHVPMPTTWVIVLDDEIPNDLTFPVFVRTPKSSWKRGGQQSKVTNLKELNDEAQLLRRSFGWDMPIIARQWLDIAVAGQWMYGDVPQEIRTWVMDGELVAWSFHYLDAVAEPNGFPPTTRDLRQLKAMAASIAGPFRSRLIAADFVRDVRGKWCFIEAGPGAVAGTAHEAVFKYVARRLIGEMPEAPESIVGGAF